MRASGLHDAPPSSESAACTPIPLGASCEAGQARRPMDVPSGLDHLRKSMPHVAQCMSPGRQADPHEGQAAFVGE